MQARRDENVYTCSTTETKMEAAKQSGETGAASVTDGGTVTDVTAILDDIRFRA